MAVGGGKLQFGDNSALTPAGYDPSAKDPFFGELSDQLAEEV